MTPLHLPARTSASRRPAVAVATCAVAVGLVGTTAAFAADDPITVRVSADGRDRAVQVDGTTVAEALDAAGVEVEEGDVVEPALDTRLADGDAVRYDDAHDVRVMADGRTWAVTTTGETVAQALADARIALGPTDAPSLAVDAPLTDGLVLSVTRVTEERVAVDEAVPFGTERRADADLARGQERVVQEGREGALRRTFLVRTVNGVATRTLEASAPVSGARTRVVAYGTAEPAPAPQPARASRGGSRTAAPAADGLDWAALARCESGGNPRAVSSNGLYHGLYQFDRRTWQGVGGSGVASDAPADEQTARAQALYAQRGASPWPTCGKHL